MKMKWKKTKNDMPDAGAAVKKEKKVLTPAEKKKRKKRILMGVVAACVALFIVSRMMAPEVLPMVTVRAVETATIEQTVDTSGTIRTEQKKDLFLSAERSDL